MSSLDSEREDLHRRSDPGTPERTKEEDMVYTLILERESPCPVTKIARELSDQLALHLTDALRQVRYGGGMIAEDLSADSGRKLQSALRAIGVATRLVEAEDWLTTPKGYRISQLHLGEDNARALLVSGREFVLRRTDIWGLHVYGLLPEELGLRPDDLERNPPPAEASSLSKRTQTLLANLDEQDLTNLVLHLTLYCADPIGPLRIRRDAFHYVGLGASKANHSLENFLILTESVLDFLPEAWNREQAVEFLLDLNPQRVFCFKQEEVQNFDRWTMLWVKVASAARNTQSIPNGSESYE